MGKPILGETMKTRSEIARELGINPSTLKKRLSVGRVKPDKEQLVGNLVRALYSASTVKRIKRMFELEPVGDKVGRPKKKKGRKKS